MTNVWLYAFLQYFGSFSNAVKVYLFEVKITNLKIYSDFCSQNLLKLTDLQVLTKVRNELKRPKTMKKEL